MVRTASLANNDGHYIRYWVKWCTIYVIISFSLPLSLSLSLSLPPSLSPSPSFPPSTLSPPSLSPSLYSYLTRLTDSLQHHLKLSHKAASQIEIQQSREEEARSLQTKLEPQLVTLIRETKRLQKLVSIAHSCTHSLMHSLTHTL